MESDRERHLDERTDRQTDRQRSRQTGMQTKRPIEFETSCISKKHSRSASEMMTRLHSWADRQTDRVSD